MGHKYSEIAFTDTVKAVQQRMGSRAAYPCLFIAANLTVGLIALRTLRLLARRVPASRPLNSRSSHTA